MLRVAFALLCVFGSGCFMLYEEDDIDDGPLPPSSVCGNAKLEYGEGCDDGNRSGGDGCSEHCLRYATPTVHWRLATLDGDDQPCPGGFDTAEVVVAPTAFDAPISQRFACSAGLATLMFERHPQQSSRDVSVRILNGTTGDVFGESLAHPLELIDAPTDSFHTIVTDAGKLRIAWTLRRGDAQSTCELLGVSSIQVEARPTAGPSVVETFPCSSYAGVMPLMPTGSYQLVLSAASTSGSASAIVDAIEVGTGGKTRPVDLVSITF